jgi:hypothetical protein
MPGNRLLKICELPRKSHARYLQKLGIDIQWVQSYITDDKAYCVYIARDEEIVR